MALAAVRAELAALVSARLASAVPTSEDAEDRWNELQAEQCRLELMIDHIDRRDLLAVAYPYLPWPPGAA